jgi:hypothetical protein
MSARAIVLVAATVVVAAGLYVLATGGDARVETESVEDRRGGAAAGASLTDVGAASGLREVGARAAGDWTVVVEGPDGDPVADASVQVERGDEVRVDLSPECTFPGLAPGAWSLHVVADGYPAWRQVVELAPGAPLRTVVRLTDEARLSGVVLDVRGEPVARTPLYLLPEGAGHPAQKGAAFGVTRATTSHDGSFAFRVTGGGAYRLSLGEAGPAARATSEPIELAVGPERTARWVVPALVRLTVSVEGLDAAEVVQVAIVTDEEASQAVAAGGAQDAETAGSGTAPPRPRAPKPSDPATGGAADGDSGAGAEASPMSPDMRRHVEAERARMANATEQDGRPLRDLRVEAGRTAVAEGLPTGGVLRFRLQRGAERVNVSTIFQPRAGDDARLTIDAPTPLPLGAPLPAERRSTGGRCQLVEPARPLLEPGLTVN